MSGRNRGRLVGGNDRRKLSRRPKFFWDELQTARLRPRTFQVQNNGNPGGLAPWSVPLRTPPSALGLPSVRSRRLRPDAYVVIVLPKEVHTSASSVPLLRSAAIFSEHSSSCRSPRRKAIEAGRKRKYGLVLFWPLDRLSLQGVLPALLLLNQL